jgi:hypothetical protein
VVSVTPRPLFSPGERTPGTLCTGGWVGPRAGLDTEARGKILCPCRRSNPDRLGVQPVVRHYTAWATPAPTTLWKLEVNCSVNRSTLMIPILNHMRLLDDEGSTHLWNVSLLQQDNTALHPRRVSPLHSPPWEYGTSHMNQVHNLTFN